MELIVIGWFLVEAYPFETANEVSGIDDAISIESKIVTSAATPGSSLEILDLFGRETRLVKACTNRVDLLKLIFSIPINFDCSSNNGVMQTSTCLFLDL